jgi:hypothetical protein
VAMVSSMRYVHLINQYLRGKRDFGYVVRLVIPLVLAIWWLQVTLAIVFTLYALSGPLRIVWLRARRSRETQAVKTAAPIADAGVRKAESP